MHERMQWFCNEATSFLHKSVHTQAALQYTTLVKLENVLRQAVKNGLPLSISKNLFLHIGHNLHLVIYPHPELVICDWYVWLFSTW